MRRESMIASAVVAALLATGCHDDREQHPADPAPAASGVDPRRVAEVGARKAPDEWKLDHVPPRDGIALGPVLRDLGAADDSIRSEALAVIRDVAPPLDGDSRRSLVRHFIAAIESDDSLRAAGGRAVFGVLCPADGWLEAAGAELLRRRNPEPLLGAIAVLRRRVDAGDPECGRQPVAPRRPRAATGS